MQRQRSHSDSDGAKSSLLRAHGDEHFLNPLWWDLDPARERAVTQRRESLLLRGLQPGAGPHSRTSVFATLHSRDLVLYGSALALTTIIGTVAASLVFESDLQGLIYPFISETARDMPQTGAFGFGMTVSSMFMIACAVLQYGKVKRDIHETNAGSKRNFCALVVGMVAPPFLGLLACYDTKRALITHRVCVVVFFSLTMCYMLLILSIYSHLAGEQGLNVKLQKQIRTAQGSAASAASAVGKRKKDDDAAAAADTAAGGAAGSRTFAGTRASSPESFSEDEDEDDDDDDKWDWEEEFVAGEGKTAGGRGRDGGLRRRRCPTNERVARVASRRYYRSRKRCMATTRSIKNVKFSLKVKQLIAGIFFAACLFYLPIGSLMVSDMGSETYEPQDVYIHAARAMCQHLAVVCIILYYGTFYYDFGDLTLYFALNEYS